MVKDDAGGEGENEPEVKEDEEMERCFDAARFDGRRGLEAH